MFNNFEYVFTSNLYLHYFSYYKYFFIKKYYLINIKILKSINIISKQIFLLCFLIIMCFKNFKNDNYYNINRLFMITITKKRKLF